MDKWLSHPTALKIISLFLGTLLWAVVHFDSERSPNTVASLTETRMIESVKLEAVGLDERNFALRLLEPTSIMLKVRGARSDLISASPEDYKMVVDVAGMEEGRHELPITVSRLPRNIELVGVTPRTATVVLESMLTKEFEVEIKTTGDPANGYKAAIPIVKPNNRVHVTLPEDQMNEVGFVGAVVDIKGEEKTVTAKKVKVVVLDKAGEEMTEAVVNPSVVEVEVPITMPFKKVPLQIGLTGKLPSGLAIASFKPSVDQVTIYGPQDVLNKYDFYDGINVDLSNLTQSGTIDLNIEPTGQIEAVDPGKVSVEIEIVEAKSMVLPQLPVSMIGLPDDFKAKLVLPSPGKMDLTIEGASSVLADISGKDLQLIADLSGLGPGSHNVKLEIHLPRFVSIVGNPPVVTVEISDGTETATPPPEDIPADVPPAGEETESPDETPIGQGGSSGATNGNNAASPGNDVEAGSNNGGTNSAGNHEPEGETNGSSTNSAGHKEQTEGGDGPANGGVNEGQKSDADETNSGNDAHNGNGSVNKEKNTKA
ncbi:CdaR family protein [Paenibacillus sp. GCM10027626]|uniref:CdaR family protein n=1 Tax=Paenibacillus sp. GCM10027626 TaxID=3273411 RepID=UPI00362EBC84